MPENQKKVCGRGGIGRHKGLKIPRPIGHAGSSPAVRTISDGARFMTPVLTGTKNLLPYSQSFGGIGNVKRKE